MKRFLALFLCTIMMLGLIGCSVDYVTRYGIKEVTIHTSIISSRRYYLDEKDDINRFFDNFKILDANFVYTATMDFDPSVELYVGGDAAEIVVMFNNDEKVMLYITKNGTVYKQSSTEIVYTDSGAVDYTKMSTFLDKIK